MNRYPVMVVLFIAAAAIPSRLARIARATGGEIMAAAQQVAGDPEIPRAVQNAAAQGRYWRASRLLGEHLRLAADTTPATILFASRLSAGWGDWVTVSSLLEGRDWLDQVGDGAGWNLLARSWFEEGHYTAADDALAHYLAVAAPGDSAAGVVLLRRGLALTEEGAADRAASAFDSAAALLPWFGDWAALFAARAAAGAGDTTQVRTRMAHVAPWLARDRGWRIRMDAARNAGDNMLARRIALDAARSAEGSGARAEAWTKLASLRLAGADTARAREAYRSAIQGAPRTSAAVDAARGLSALSPSPEEWRMIGAIYLRHGNQARAANAFRRYLDADVGTEAQRQDVQLQLGKALYDSGRYREAERRLLALAEDGAPARVAAEALYLAGRAEYREGRGSEGQKTFLRLADRYPNQEAAARGLFLLADLKHDTGDLEAARRYYRLAAAAAPELNETGLARMRLAGLEMMEGDFTSAAALFDDYLDKFPDGRRASQAAYWAARAYEQLGRDSLAEARLKALRGRDPLSFYGARAAALLGEGVLDIPMSPAPPKSERADSLVQQALRRVDVLSALNLHEDLAREVTQLRQHFSREVGGEYALAEALNARGYTLTGVSMGWDLHEREGSWNRRLLRIIYPFPFRQLVVPEAREQGLDPYLVAGVIRRESAFNPTVVSGAGAIGLMQIIPVTGRGLARAAGLNHFDSSLLERPEVNVHLGVRYLANLMKRFDGELPLVLSAYNAGPNRAVAWRKLPESRDPDLLTERIPYGETRDYVRNVLLHQLLYRALYPEIQGLPDELIRVAPGA